MQQGLHDSGAKIGSPTKLSNVYLERVLITCYNIITSHKRGTQMTTQKEQLLRVFWAVNSALWLAWAAIGTTPINPEPAPIWLRIFCGVVGLGCILRYRDLTPPEVRSVRRLGRARLRTREGSRLLLRELRHMLLTGSTVRARIAAAEAIALYPTYTGAACLAEAVRSDSSAEVRRRSFQLLHTSFSEEAMLKMNRPAHDIEEDCRLIAELLETLQDPDSK
jgi:hypothetical protein